MRSSGKIRPHYQSVYKEAYQTFHFSLGSIGNGRPDDNVLLIGITIKQRLKRSQQGHEQGNVLFTAQLIERFREFTVNEECVMTAGKGLHGRPRTIAWQFE